MMRTGTARRTRGHARAFTLLELVVVLAILGLVVAMVGAAIGRSAPGRERRAALVSLVAALGVERIHAMEQGAPVGVRVIVADDTIVMELDGSDERREFDCPATRPAGTQGEGRAMLSLEFDADGRTPARSWAFAGAGSERTIWRIEFDPVSGAPSLQPGDTGAGDSDGARRGRTP